MNREKILRIINESEFGTKIYLAESDYGDPEFSTQSVGEEKEFVVKYFDRLCPCINLVSVFFRIRKLR